ncbi:MAG: hypothetical protein LBL83_13545 [Clostridiales bacterium]|jgi:hypothetical protein|nr:hypothetical protein [Clostridiales bacterium]
MLEGSLDAVRAKLAGAFPEAAAIYVNSVPEGFDRPSLYVELARAATDDLSRTLRNMTATWQVVYFPEKDEAGNSDMFALHGAAGRIGRAFGDEPFLRGEDGSVYHVLDVSGGARDGAAYFDVRLEAQRAVRPEPAEIVGAVEHKIKGGP